MKLLSTSFRAMANPLKQPSAALSTSAVKLDQAYRIEADTFGELKVSRGQELRQFKGGNLAFPTVIVISLPL